MTPGVISALNILVIVIIWSLIISVPILIMILLLQKYDRYIKDRDKEIKDAERIIVKQNKEVVEATKALDITLKLNKEEEFKSLKLEKEIRELELKKEALEKELNIETEAVELLNEDSKNVTVDYKLMTIRDLQQLAKNLEMKGYSRWSKAKLVERLPVMTTGQLESYNTHADDVVE